jgi:signal transduction histidine kinase/ActR/RegA family two-component response regulator
MPYGHDAENVARLLRASGYLPTISCDLDKVAAALDDNLGAIVLTDEALRADTGALKAALCAQPAWSDIPFVILVPRPKSLGSRYELNSDLFSQITTNFIVLERPLSTQSLISAVHTALRNRQRQFLVRDQMNALETAAAELETRVQERTAALKMEMESRERAEAALRQAQKMESIGQLTGGIAHDFNNIIQGISGAIRLIQRRMAAGRTDDINMFLDAASDSCKRAASLTQRLLAFSRRQMLESKPVDVNDMVRSLLDLLRRTVTEKIVLRVDLKAAKAAMTDINQLETSLLNLIINARDAMPDGGIVTLATSIVPAEVVPPRAGRESASVPEYVRIDVTDTGVGMEKEVVDKAFDPFFTTKPLGAGTGLGLSMVYGFAHQSGGCVAIDSAPGRGTTVSIFLPATSLHPEEKPVAPHAPDPDGDGMHVLIVDDEDHVRMVVREVLSDMGYASMSVADPYAALSALTRPSRIDLLITDVGLPGMNGRELAESARKLRPELPVLFITGYAENAAIRESFLGTNMAMITKPFELEQLSAKIVEILGPAPAAKASADAKH